MNWPHRLSAYYDVKARNVVQINHQGIQEEMSQNHSTNISIRSFILRKFPAARKNAITDDSPLLESGVIDSLGMLDVVAFLEDSFNIKVLDEELIPENFANIHRMAAFAEKKRTQSQVSA